MAAFVAAVSCAATAAAFDASPGSVDLGSTPALTIVGLPESSNFNAFSAAPAGDVNGDGRADIVIGAGNANLHNRHAGAAWVVFGRTFPATVDVRRDPGVLRLVAARPRKLFESHDDPETELAGFDVGAVGDVNDDGLDDVAVGAPFASHRGRFYSGSIYVVFGRRAGGRVNLGKLGARGYRIDGASGGSTVGVALARAGDVNGDGRQDLLVGSLAGLYRQHGQAWVVFGQPAPRSLDLAHAGSRALEIHGARRSTLGPAVTGAGDVNGDGFGDLAVGAPYDGTGRDREGPPGATYVIYGRRANAAIDVRSLGGLGYRIDGAPGDAAGAALAVAGDVNGDGRPDLVVGAPGMGAAYVVFGQRASSRVDLANLGEAGQRFEGAPLVRGAFAGDSAGQSVAGAGDVNGDGLGDVLIGAPTATVRCRVDAGAAYLVYGSPAAGTRRLTDLGGGGYRIDGAETVDNAGAVLSSFPDASGDGRPDLLIAAPQYQFGGVRVGRHFPNWTVRLIASSATPPEASPDLDGNCLSIEGTAGSREGLLKGHALEATVFVREPARNLLDVELLALRGRREIFLASRVVGGPLASDPTPPLTAGRQTVRIKLPRRGRNRLRRLAGSPLRVRVRLEPNGANECCSAEFSATRDVPAH